MANRASLINSKALTNSIYALYREPGNRLDPAFIEVATDRLGIPLPWFCCFRPANLRPMVVTAGEEDDEADAPDEVTGRYSVPCASLAQAAANLEASLPLFEALASSPQEGRTRWQAAVQQVRALPLPNLTLSILELVQTDEDHASFLAALAGDESAIPHLKRWLWNGDDSLGTQIHFAIPKAPAPPALTATEQELAQRFPGVDPRWLEFRRAWTGTEATQDRKDLARNKLALEDYVRNGYADRRRKFAATWGAGHPPRQPLKDWEHYGDGDLLHHAELQVRELVRKALREGRLDSGLASRAFAAAFTACWIDLHFHLLYPRRFDGQLARLPRRFINFAALGFVAGAHSQAGTMAGALIAARAKGFFRDNDFDFQAQGFMLDLMALQLGLPAGKSDSASRPEFARLLDCALKPDSSGLQAAALAACDLHTHGPRQHQLAQAWALLPIELLLVSAMRTLAAAEPLRLDHPLVAPAFAIEPAQVGWRVDPLVAEVRERMVEDGLQEAAILTQVRRP